MNTNTYFTLSKLKVRSGFLEKLFFQSLFELPFVQDHYSDGAIGKPSCYFGPLPIAYDIIVHEAKELPSFLVPLKQLVQSQTGEVWEAVYLNFYRDGNDVIRKHSDNGNGSVAAVSVSLGATRNFCYETPDGKEMSISLPHGSLLEGDFLNLVHWVAPEPKVLVPRLNFTFRKMEAYVPGSFVATPDQFVTETTKS